MFESLDKLDWSSYLQAHGNAGHVPNAIRGLISDVPAEREQAYWKLDNYIVLQSDLYESALYVIPFLIEILKSKFSLGRGRIYDLLYEIGNGAAPDTVRVYYNNSHMSLQSACHLVISEQINIYLDEIENVNSNVREKALELMYLLSDCKAEILPRLVLLCSAEKNVVFSNEMRDLISELEQ